MKEFTDRLTIAIPVFERTEFFTSAVESVSKQTCSCNVIVVDNASSHTYFKDYCEANQIDYYRNECNIGMFGNWNRCFELCSTEFLMILGDDDVIESNFVVEFVKALNSFPNIDVFFSNFSLLDNETGETKEHSHKLPFGYIADGLEVVEYGLKFGLGFPVISSIIKRSKFNGFYTSLHASNDWVWLYENAIGLKFFGEQQKLLRYRSHGKQDHKVGRTHINCMLSIAYIYGSIFERTFANDEELRALSRARTFNVLLYLASRADRSLLAEYLTMDNVYCVFFKEWLSNRPSYSLVLKLPLMFRKGLYSILRRLSIFDPI